MISYHIIFITCIVYCIVLFFYETNKTGATLISPDGFFDIDDDDDAPNVKEADVDTINVRFPKPPNELTDPETWKHHFTDYNSIGRTLILPEVLDANGDVRTVSCPFVWLFFFYSTSFFFLHRNFFSFHLALFSLVLSSAFPFILLFKFI